MALTGQAANGRTGRPQTVPSVTNKVARGIVSEYPTVRSLLNAYETARSTEDAQLLLQDIAVRGGAAIAFSSSLS